MDRGPDFYAGVSSNLSALACCCLFGQPSAFFARTFQSYQTLASMSRTIFPSQMSGSALRKISMSNQRRAPEPMGLAGEDLPGHAMACSLRDSLQGLQGRLPHLTQRTSSITLASHFPQSGQATIGHREALLPNLQLSESSTRYPHLQAVRTRTVLAFLQLSEDINSAA